MSLFFISHREELVPVSCNIIIESARSVNWGKILYLEYEYDEKNVVPESKYG